MTCKECKYFDNEGPYFENTTLKTCKCSLYLLKELAKTFNKGGKSHAYYTTALTNENDTCKFEYILLTFDD